MVTEPPVPEVSTDEASELPAAQGDSTRLVQVTPGVSVRDTLDRQTAFRLYWFEGRAGGTLSITPESTSGDFQPLLVLYDSALAELQRGPLASGMAMDLAADDVYFLAVSLPGRLVPAGAFFFPVTDRYVRARKPLGDEELEREHFAASRVRGFVLDDPTVLRLMDRGIESTARSRPLLPVNLTASGRPRKGEPAVDEDRMRALLDFTLLKLRSLSKSVTAGKIDIGPAFLSPGDTACRFCDYRPVCRFDPKAGDEFRRPPRVRGDDVWTEMTREIEKGRHGERKTEEESEHGG